METLAIIVVIVICLIIGNFIFKTNVQAAKKIVDSENKKNTVASVAEHLQQYEVLGPGMIRKDGKDYKIGEILLLTDQEATNLKGKVKLL